MLCSVEAPECVCSFAGAVFVTDESVQAGGTEAVLAAGALKALVAQTGPVDVVALGPVLTVTLVGALRPVGADRTFILASGSVSNKNRYNKYQCFWSDLLKKEKMSLKRNSEIYKR